MRIRDYVETDRARVNEVALAAFAPFCSHYDDWTAMAAGIGNMAALAESGEIIIAEHDDAIIGAVAYIRRMCRRPTTSIRRGRSSECSSWIRERGGSVPDAR